MTGRAHQARLAAHSAVAALDDAHTAARAAREAELLAEVRFVRLIEAMRPYLISSPLPAARPPTMRIPSQRDLAMLRAEHRARALGARPAPPLRGR